MPALATDTESLDLTAVRHRLRKEGEAITPRKRFRTTTRILMKHGVFHILRDRSKDDETKHRLLGKRLRLAFEELGPTYIKLGQVILTRQELLPDALTKELEPLLSDVPPLSFPEMQTVLEDNIPDWREMFDSIDPTPIGSASLAQVYRGRLKDGRPAAVKIIRPLVGKLFQADITVIRKLVRRVYRMLPPEMTVSLDLPGLLEDYYSSSRDELDLRREAEIMNIHREMISEFATLHIPEVYHVTEHVLVMEYIDGWNLKNFPVDFLTFEERMERMLDLGHWYVKTFVAGYYHADPHGSNIMIDRHTKKAVIIDWGMTGTMDAVHTEAIFRLLMHVRLNQAEDAIEAGMDVCEPTRYTDTVNLKDQLRSLFIHYTMSHQGSRYNWGSLLMNTILICAKNHCRIPTGLALWTKGFSAAEATARWLCPEICYHDVVETADVQIMRSWLSRRLNYRANASLLAETAKLVTTLPRRLNKFLEYLEWNKLHFTMDAQLSKPTARLLHKVSNRVSLSFLAGTFFLGGSLMLSFGARNGAALGGIETLGTSAVIVSAVLTLLVLWSVFRSRRV
ncbi:ABC1 kinase family protein [Alicyclobacillus herbarius]|uniref:ABC1 kinase family protein n=1 Tax=Alicyclobacillus herbarius TaxID=122960 RepID=UPI00055558E8|nr:AarF/UbiB family protein [Alicyclobacillus herbarius]